MEASALGAGSAGSSPSPAPWLSPSVPVGLRPAPTTPSQAAEHDTRSGGAFLREPAAPLCARAAATHASGALCGAEPHQRRVRHGFPCRPLGSWTRTKCIGRHWCATVWTETLVWLWLWWLWLRLWLCESKANYYLLHAKPGDVGQCNPKLSNPNPVIQGRPITTMMTLMHNMRITNRTPTRPRNPKSFPNPGTRLKTLQV